MVSCSSLLRFTNFSPYTLRGILNQSNISTILRNITTEDYRSANKLFLSAIKIIQLKNDYNHVIFNGDMGIIKENHEADGTLTI